MNPLFIPVYQLYLLQLENYELERYWSLLLQKGYLYSSTPLRKTIVWTQKAKSVFFLALVMYGVIVGAVWFLTSGVLTISSFIIGFVLFPVFYTAATLFLCPVDYVVKQFFIAKAKHILASSQAKVIGIAGSYGKTTIKNIMSSVLSVKFNVITTPESVNTPIGIAQWLIKTISKQTEIAIIEMGEHYRGDIRGLCKIFTPDIAILTGINEAHLERLKTLETSVATMFEIVEHAKPNGHIILNADDDHIRNFYKKYGKDKHISFYSSINNSLAELKITKKIFDEEKLCWFCTIEKVGNITLRLLGEYALGDVVVSILIGKSLGMNNDELKKGIASLIPISHRLEPIHGSGGVLVIDDSYNGNPDGVREAIRVLARFKKRRKVFITPGLVEIGDKAVMVHEEIGRALADVADLVILVKNSVTPYIENGLKEKKFDVSRIIWFNTAGEAHEALSGIVKENDVILFQNDWGDQYI